MLAVVSAEVTRRWSARGRGIIEIVLTAIPWLWLSIPWGQTLLWAAPPPAVAGPTVPTLDPVKRLELQVELIKQIVQIVMTLATALIAFSGSLLLGFVKHDVRRADRWLLAAWMAMILSVLFGAGVFMSLIPSLDISNRPVYSPGVINDAVLHIGLFLMGLVFFLRWIWVRIKAHAGDKSHLG